MPIIVFHRWSVRMVGDEVPSRLAVEPWVEVEEYPENFSARHEKFAEIFFPLQCWLLRIALVELLRS